jgi:hypothetical protein
LNKLRNSSFWAAVCLIYLVDCMIYDVKSLDNEFVFVFDVLTRGGDDNLSRIFVNTPFVSFVSLTQSQSLAQF